MADSKLIGLNVGCPGGQVLQGCKDIILEATKSILHENADEHDILKYGNDGGDRDCRESIAQFLSDQYGSPVSSDTVILTAGATHGLHFVLTTLMDSSKFVFIEDPAYFYAIPLMRDDLQKTLLPVSRDDEGMLPEMLEDLCIRHKPKDWTRSEKSRYWASVYFVPTFNNPTGQTYSDGRFKQLVDMARKHDILLIAEDLYRFLSYSDQQTTSLLQKFDHSSDPDYKGGHLISNSSFSKVLAPGMRLGWIEGPGWMIERLARNHVSKSGGCFNQYASKLVSEVIRSGRLKEQVKKIRKIYKQRMSVLVKSMSEHLPEGCRYEEPKGGYYLWISLRDATDAVKFQQFAMQNCKVTFIPGESSSPTGSFKNCVRLSIAAWDEPELIEGAKRFCNAYKNYLDL